MLSALGERLGIPGLALDAQGCCRLVFDGRRMLELRASSAQRRLVMSIRLSRDGASGAAGVERALLQANLWGAGTGGGWFALDERGQACLQQEVMLGDDSAAQLLAKTEGMLGSIDLWERRLAGEGAGFVSPDAMAMARATQRV